MEFKRRRLVSTWLASSKAVVSSTTTTTMDDLKDDELIEILVRLPSFESVNASKFVCKRWLSLISDPSFGDYYTKHGSNLNLKPPRRDSFLLFQTVDDYDDTVGKIKGLSLDDNDDGSHKFFSLPLDYIPVFQTSRVDQQSDLMQFTISGACRDLMLLDVSYEYPVPRRLLIVCNPITKQWLQLPALSPNPSSSSKYCSIDSNMRGGVGFTCNPVQRSNRVGFTVVHIGCYYSSDDQIRREGFLLQVYVSSSNQEHNNKWRTYRVPCPLDFFECCPFGVEVVCCNGVFYWKDSNYVVGYDPINEPNQCHFFNVPADLNNKTYNLAVVSGATSQIQHLRICSSTLSGAFSVWDLVDYNNHKWILKYSKTYLPGGCFQRFASFSPTNADRVYFTYYITSSINLEDLSNQDLFQKLLSLPPGSGIMLGNVVPFVVPLWPSCFHS